VGLGKAGDTSLAIDKATRHAKKNMIKVTLSPQMTIPHAVEAKFSSAMVMLMPAKGRGVVAGSAVRNVIEHAGIKDICGKLLSGSKNKLNIARATVKALEQLSKHSREALNPSLTSNK
jgi:small subunit ribosomal protein S5